MAVQPDHPSLLHWHGSGSALQRVIDALDALDCRPKGNYERGYIALCPAHDDNDPSLQVTPPHRRKNKRGVGIHCHTGCTPTQVLDALGMTWSQLFDE